MDAVTGQIFLGLSLYCDVAILTFGKETSGIRTHDLHSSFEAPSLTRSIKIAFGVYN